MKNRQQIADELHGSYRELSRAKLLLLIDEVRQLTEPVTLIKAAEYTLRKCEWMTSDDLCEVHDGHAMLAEGLNEISAYVYGEDDRTGETA